MSNATPNDSLRGRDFTPLYATGLLDSAPEPIFDQLTALVTKILRVPVALISLVDGKRQFFKSQCGLPEPVATDRETPLSHSLCQHVVAQGDALVITDARTHPLGRENLAVRDLGVIAYAGMPLHDAEGNALGALCAIDSRPREWTIEELEILRTLASQVMAEIHLRSETESLRRAEEHRSRMARLDRHDLRTPLNALSLALQALPILGPLNELQTDCVAKAVKNCRSAADMVDKMLDVAVIDHQGHGALDVRPCSPHEIVLLAIDQVALQAKERDIQLATMISSDIPPVVCDQDKLVRVLTNLLNNAVKFTPVGGCIAISAKHRNNDGHNSVVFAVVDSGVGISEEDSRRVFREGFRLAADGQASRSTGLGLTFCKSVVEAHGGRIWLQSTPGQGSTFAFAIPALEDDSGH